jgi:outer membrane lipoprotein-sorting protein
MEPSEEDLKNVTITKGDETKNVLGYECQEYNVEVNKDGVVVKMDVYTTDKLSAISQQSTMMGADISGFPLFMTMNMSQMGMNLTITNEVTEIKEESVSDEKFDMTPPEGYEKTDKLQGM